MKVWGAFGSSEVSNPGVTSRNLAYKQIYESVLTFNLTLI